MYGYFTADFLYSENMRAVHAVGLDCFLNERTSSLFMLSYCADVGFDKERNKLVGRDGEEKVFIYCPYIKLWSMPALPVFFKNCKFENISFDFESKNGTAFVLLDKLENEHIGVLCV